jgi:hypothetical protein
MLPNPDPLGHEPFQRQPGLQIEAACCAVRFSWRCAIRSPCCSRPDCGAWTCSRCVGAASIRPRAPSRCAGRSCARAQGILRVDQTKTAAGRRTMGLPACAIASLDRPPRATAPRSAGGHPSVIQRCSAGSHGFAPAAAPDPGRVWRAGRRLAQPRQVPGNADRRRRIVCRYRCRPPRPSEGVDDSGRLREPRSGTRQGDPVTRQRTGHRRFSGHKRRINDDRRKSAASIHTVTAPPAGIEPATDRLEGGCSIR